MKNRRDPAKREALWLRYWAIRDDHANGHATPILWHLALGHDPRMMLLLAVPFPIPANSRMASAGSGSAIAPGGSAIAMVRSISR
jgi:hypothetical protein